MGTFDTGVIVARRRRRGRQKKIAARPSVGRLVKRPHVNMGTVMDGIGRAV